MAKIEKLRVNTLPSPTWNKLGMNGAILKEVALTSQMQVKADSIDMGKVAFIPENSEIDALFNEMDAYQILIENTPSELIVLDLSAENGQECGAVFEIQANANATLIFRMQSAKDAEGFAGVLIRAKLAENVKLHIVQFNAMGDDFRVISALEGECSDKAELQLTTVSLGGAETYLGAKANLIGKESAFDSYTSYILENGQKLDMNYVADHIGKLTNANIISSGVMHGNTFKISRQTINFISGCSGSKGAESEDVLLLDEDVVNKSVPLILCTEEDVEGEHGASIGQLDETLLFYMQSRGLDKETIYKMLSQSRIETAIRRMNHPETAKLIDSRLGITEEDML
ncbi:MAG: SufD family Fe-S cluster assembly protein [Oscillospiraceae bacterium]